MATLTSHIVIKLCETNYIWQHLCMSGILLGRVSSTLLSSLNVNGKFIPSYTLLNSINISEENKTTIFCLLNLVVAQRPDSFLRTRVACILKRSTLLSPAGKTLHLDKPSALSPLKYHLFQWQRFKIVPFSKQNERGSSTFTSSCKYIPINIKLKSCLRWQQPINQFRIIQKMNKRDKLTLFLSHCKALLKSSRAKGCASATDPRGGIQSK